MPAPAGAKLDQEFQLAKFGDTDKKNLPDHVTSGESGTCSYANCFVE